MYLICTLHSYFSVPPAPYILVTEDSVDTAIITEGRALIVECITPLADPREVTLSVYNDTKHIGCEPIASGTCIKLCTLFPLIILYFYSINKAKIVVNDLCSSLILQTKNLQTIICITQYILISILSCSTICKVWCAHTV